LVLSRPAWSATPNPEAVRLFTVVARLLEEHGPETGLLEFRRTAEYRAVAAEFPDTARSLESQFLRPRARETGVLLTRIVRDEPHPGGWEKRVPRVPTLVLANRQDPIHPFAYGEALARSLPGADLRELTSKSVDAGRHVEQVQTFLGEFFHQYFPTSPG
jgi:pimeloyl-ACP methyl ester carboxylesterase